MNVLPGLPYSFWSGTPTSMRMLASLLELALDTGQSVVMMRIGAVARSIYIGHPANTLDALVDHGTVDAADADEMLALTTLGLNSMTSDGQIYRFTRSVRYVADQQAVIFTPT